MKFFKIFFLIMGFVSINVFADITLTFRAKNAAEKEFWSKNFFKKIGNSLVLEGVTSFGGMGLVPKKSEPSYFMSERSDTVEDLSVTFSETISGKLIHFIILTLNGCEIAFPISAGAKYIVQLSPCAEGNVLVSYKSATAPCPNICVSEIIDEKVKKELMDATVSSIIAKRGFKTREPQEAINLSGSGGSSGSAASATMEVPAQSSPSNRSNWYDKDEVNLLLNALVKAIENWKMRANAQ